MCLWGRAQRPLSELTNRKLNKYVELKRALTQIFSPAEHKAAYVLSKCRFGMKWQIVNATQLVVCFRGQAQIVPNELRNRKLKNYVQLKSEHQKKIRPAEHEAAYRCDIRKRRRKFGKSVANYGYTLRRLASRAFPFFLFDMREGLRVEQYVG